MYISGYRGVLTPEGFIKGVKRIKMAFPSLPPSFYEILSERIKELGFSDERFADAINYVIDTCTYPTPTVANFISFDKGARLYTHYELVKMMEDYCGNVWDDFKPVHIDGLSKPLFASLADIERYKLNQIKK